MASSEELGPSLTTGAEGGQHKGPSVRSVLLRKDSPGAEGRLHRRHRPHQVRFKDLEDSSSSKKAPLPTETPCASGPLQRGGNPAWQSWPQAKPCLLPLPSCPKRCASTAIQTSPGLQQPSEGGPFPSQSACAFAHLVGHPPGGLGQDPPPWGSTSLSAYNRCPASPQAQVGSSPHATVCPTLPPSPLCPSQSSLGRILCLPAGSPFSQQQPCAATPQLPPSPPRNSRSSKNPSTLFSRPPAHQPPSPFGTAPAQQAPPATPSASRQQLPGALVWGRPSPCPFAQGSSQKETGPRLPPQLPHVDPQSPLGSAWAEDPTAAARRDQSSSPIAEKRLPPPQVAVYPLLVRPLPSRACLTPMHAESLQHVQDLLHLVAVGQAQQPGPSKAAEWQPPTSQDFPQEMGDIRSQLQSLEGVLETSQQTIRVLLGVIQDLEKKEAQRDGRQSYRTGQDIANCGMCRDCACVIYSVEHDFRQQEGRFKQVLSTIELEPGQRTPTAGPAATLSCHELPPAPWPPMRAEPKKSRRRCFWFL